MQLSQDSAVTDLKWGENFNKFLFRNLLLNIAVKKLRKLVNICQNYHKNKRVSFFYGSQCSWQSCYNILTAVDGCYRWKLAGTAIITSSLQRKYFTMILL